MKKFADLCLKIIKIILCAISIGAFIWGCVYLWRIYLGYLIHDIVQAPSSEYRALCIKKEGKPVFNGEYWECMK